MAQKQIRWLFWDGTYSDNGALNKLNGITATRPPKQGANEARAKHKIALALGEVGFSLAKGGVSVRIAHMPNELDLGAERLGLQLKIKRDAQVKSLLFRVKDRDDRVVYQEVFTKAEVAALPDEAQPTNMPAAHPKATDANYVADLRNKGAHPGGAPYKPEIWVSKNTNAFQIRGGSTARLLPVDVTPTAKFGFQVPHTAVDKTNKKKKPGWNKTATDLKEAAQAAFEAKVKAKKLRVAILHANTSMEISEDQAHLRAALADEIAATYRTWGNDPLTGNAINWGTLSGAPHIASTAVNSNPFSLKDEINFDSWPWRLRYMNDMLAAIDGANDSSGAQPSADGTDVVKLFLAPEWYFNNSKTMLRQDPGAGTAAIPEYAFDQVTRRSRPTSVSARRKGAHPEDAPALRLEDANDYDPNDASTTWGLRIVKSGPNLPLAVVHQSGTVQVKVPTGAPASAQDVADAINNDPGINALIQATAAGADPVPTNLPETTLPTPAGATDQTHAFGASTLKLELTHAARTDGRGVTVTFAADPGIAAAATLQRSNIFLVQLATDGAQAITSTSNDVKTALDTHAIAQTYMTVQAVNVPLPDRAFANVTMDRRRTDTPFRAVDHDTRNHGNQLVNYRPLLEAEMTALIDELKLMSGRLPSWLIVPGTILWKRPRSANTDHTKPWDQQDWITFNTVVVLHNGEVIHKQHKMFHGGDSDGGTFGRNDGRNGMPKLTFSGKLRQPDFALFDPARVNANARVEYYGDDNANGMTVVPNGTTIAPSIFTFGGLTFALDICRDHGSSRALRDYAKKVPGGFGADVQIIVSSGKHLQYPAVKPGGYVALCDTGANKAGVYYVKKRLAPVADIQAAAIARYDRDVQATMTGNAPTAPAEPPLSSLWDIEPAPPNSGSFFPHQDVKLFEAVSGHPDGITRHPGATNLVADTKPVSILLFKPVELGKPY